jgi:hypothetical protein
MQIEETENELDKVLNIPTLPPEIRQELEKVKESTAK